MINVTGEYTVEQWKAAKQESIEVSGSRKEKNAIKAEILARPGVMKVWDTSVRGGQAYIYILTLAD